MAITQTTNANTNAVAEKSTFGRVCENIKLVLGSGNIYLILSYILYINTFYLLLAVVTLLVLVAFVGIANGWCILQVHPAVNFMLLFCALVLLAYVEALHYACKSIIIFKRFNNYPY